RHHRPGRTSCPPWAHRHPGGGMSLRFRGKRHNARSLALQVLLDGSRHEGFAQELLDRHLGPRQVVGWWGGGVVEGPTSPPHHLPDTDRRLATQLVYGVLRRRGTLLALVRPLVNRPRDRVEPWVWDVLCLGACQLALLSHIPAHAALNETVELAALYGRAGA